MMARISRPTRGSKSSDQALPPAEALAAAGVGSDIRRTRNEFASAHSWSDAFDNSLGAFCKPSPGGLRCEPEWHAGSWQIERGANGSLIVRNDDITVNPTPSAAEERSEDAVTLKAANDEASWQLQRMSRPCNYDASTLSSAASPDR